MKNNWRDRTLLGLQAWPAAATAWSLLVLGAAWQQRRRPLPAPGPQRRMLVLVPAHDEEAVIGAALAAIAADPYPDERRRLVVLADNCTDRTAAIARAAGAEVLQRTDAVRTGKGAALEWAAGRLLGEDGWDALVVIDADCEAAPGLLGALDSALERAPAAQADYVVSNAEESWQAALRHASFRLVNTVRPLGREGLGGSAGLTGSGMALRRELLERIDLAALPLVEDAELHLRLVAAGERSAFAPQGCVRSPMPATLPASATQQERWEAGWLSLLLRWPPRLLAAALRRRSRIPVIAAADLAVPPQSLLAALNGGLLAAALILRARRARRLGLAACAGQVSVVAGGLALVRAPAAAWRALAFSPVLAAFKLRVMLRAALGRTSGTFERTPR